MIVSMVRHFGEEQHALAVEREVAARFSALRQPVIAEVRRRIAEPGIRADTTHEGTASSRDVRCDHARVVRMNFSVRRCA